MTNARRVCTRCGKPHGVGKNGNLGRGYFSWVDADLTRERNNEIPESSLGPMRVGPVFSFNVFPEGSVAWRSHALEGMTWAQYAKWLVDGSNGVNPKGKYGVTNYSLNGRRREEDMAHCDRFYFDCDKAGPWDRLVSALSSLGIPAIFHESSGSVRRRGEAGDVAGNMPASKWHVEIPLARTIQNPLAGVDKDENHEEWRHAKEEWKRKYRHVAAVLSAMAGFGGVGGNCGFDLAPSQMCAVRYLGARPWEGGPVPHILVLAGDKALDWERLLSDTGYEPGERRRRLAQIRTIRSGGSVTTFHNGEDKLADRIRCVETGKKVTDLLKDRGEEPTDTVGHYFCPMHGGSGHSFHVWEQVDTGSSIPGSMIELWKCHSDCDDSGDVIKLHSILTGMRWIDARNDLARELNLDPLDYLPEADEFKVDESRKPVCDVERRNGKFFAWKVKPKTEREKASDPKAERPQATEIPEQHEVASEEEDQPAAEITAEEPETQLVDEIASYLPGEVAAPEVSLAVLKKLPKAEKPSPEAEDDDEYDPPTSPEAPPAPEPSKILEPDKPKAKKKKRGLPSIARWVNAAVVACQELGSTVAVIRYVSRVLLEFCQVKVKVVYDAIQEGVNGALALKVSPDHVPPERQVRGLVVEAQDRIVNGKNRQGRKRIVVDYGFDWLWSLAETVAHDVPEAEIIPLYKKVLGLELVDGEEANYLKSMTKGYSDAKVDELVDAEGPTRKTPEKQEEYRDKTRERVRNLLMRPCGCRRFKQRRKGEFDEEMGRDPKWRPLVCESLLCPRCWMLRCIVEYEMVKSGWTTKRKKKKKDESKLDCEVGAKKSETSETNNGEDHSETVDMRWEGKGPFHMVEVIKIPDEARRKELLGIVNRRVGDPKVRVSGMIRGLPSLVWVLNSKAGADHIRDVIRARFYGWKRSGVEISTGKYDEGVKLTRSSTPDHTRAISLALRHKISLHIHARFLAQKGMKATGQERDELKDKLVTFLKEFTWKHATSCGEGSLGWPSRQDVRDSFKEENDDVDGEEVVWELLHVVSGKTWEKRKHPWVINEAMSAYDADRSTMEYKAAA